MPAARCDIDTLQHQIVFVYWQLMALNVQIACSHVHTLISRIKDIVNKNKYLVFFEAGHSVHLYHGPLYFYLSDTT